MAAPGVEASFNARQVLAAQHNDEIVEPQTVDELDVEEPIIEADATGNTVDPNQSSYQDEGTDFWKNFIEGARNMKPRR